MWKVTATGMGHLYPGVCEEGILYPHAHFSGKMCHQLTWADTLLVTSRVFLGPYQQTVEMDTHVSIMW